MAASGLVWAVTWSGSALVRLGVAVTEPTGAAWVEVSSDWSTAAVLSCDWSTAAVLSSDWSRWPPPPPPRPSAASPWAGPSSGP